MRVKEEERGIQMRSGRVGGIGSSLIVTIWSTVIIQMVKEIIDEDSIIMMIEIIGLRDTRMKKIGEEGGGGKDLIMVMVEIGGPAHTQMKKTTRTNIVGEAEKGMIAAVTLTASMRER